MLRNPDSVCCCLFAHSRNSIYLLKSILLVGFLVAFTGDGRLQAQSGPLGDPAATNNQTESKQNGQIQQIHTDRGVFTTRSQPMSLALPPDDDVFQFAIYGDRTGGDPSGLKVLRQAVEDTNLLNPDLVMTVGDLIQGYNRPPEWMREMREFRDIMDELNMQWFPVAGNHDIYWDFRDPQRPQGHHEENYEKNFGPLWYSFVHKQNGFIVLFSDEGDLETGEKGFGDFRMQNMSPAQLAFLEQALARLRPCKKVFVFLHHPRWLGNYRGSNWNEVHRRLVDAGNVAAVFAGHIHHMTYTGPVDGIEYYSLATTGGHLSMENPELGYVHHFNVVTVRPDHFTVATVPVGAVMDPKQFDNEFMDDVQRVRQMRPERVGEKLAMKLDGTVAQEYKVRLTNPGKYPIEVTLTPRIAGPWKAIPDHQHVVIPPGKTDGGVIYFHRQPESSADPTAAGKWSDNSVPALAMSVDYLHTESRVRLPQVRTNIDLALADLSDDLFQSESNGALQLRGEMSASIRRARDFFNTDSARIQSNDVPLPQGPFTLEAWVNPSRLGPSRAVVAKTQSSEYALFLHEGVPQFDVHLGGRYVAPKDSKKIMLDQWTHLAGVFDGNECRLYVNGKQVDAKRGSGERTTNQLPLFIGADPDGWRNPTREFAGQLDEIRLSTGVRYTDDFEPAKRHVSDDQTVLLLHCDQQIGPFLLDDSRRRTSVLLLGNAKVGPPQ